MSAGLTETLHATAFIYHQAGCLVLGPSGSGKSRLAAEALLHGGQLVADDRVQLAAENGQLMARALPGFEGVIELRGVGLITTPHHQSPARIDLVLAFDPAADERLPEPQMKRWCGVELPYLQIAPLPGISPASILLYLEAMQEHRILPADWRPKG